MGEVAGIYWRLLGSRVRSRFQYRASFAFQFVGTFLLSFMDFVVVLVLFSHLPHLDGWTLGEVAFLYGSSYVVFKIADVAVGNLDKIPELVRTGEFDGLLTRPLSSLGQVAVRDVDLHHIGGALQGALVFWFALTHVDIAWDPVKAVLLVAMLAGGLAIFVGVWIVTNALAFWIVDAREVANSFTYGGNFLTTYPLQIFATWMRRIFAFVIPMAFVNYLPALRILDKPDPLGLPPVLGYLSLPVAGAVAVVAGGVWRTAVRHYRSTGS